MLLARGTPIPNRKCGGCLVDLPDERSPVVPHDSSFDDEADRLSPKAISYMGHFPVPPKKA